MAQTVNDTKSQTGILIVASLVSSLIMLDSNIVAVSLPAIGETLRASFSQIEWVVSSYLLAYASLLLAAGNFADMVGRRKSMQMGVVVFGLASLGCGFAQASWQLNAARAAQGVGGAMLLTSSLAIITRTFSGESRAHAFAVWGASLGIALTLGPILGGLITQTLGWRWIFLVNVPVCVGLVIAATMLVPESRDEKIKTLDFKGALTFTPGLFFLTWALINGNSQGWAATATLVQFGAAVLFMASFVFVELKGSRPMVDMTLFARHNFQGAVTAMAGYGAAAQVMIFYLPLYLQIAYGFGPLQAGLAILPFAVPMTIVPRFVSGWSLTSSKLLVLGLLVSAVANALFWTIAHVHLSYWLFAGAMVIAGVGAGILNGETVKAVGDAVPAERAGMASGIASTVRFIGVLVGVAGLGAVLSLVAQGRFIDAATTLGLNANAAQQAGARAVSGDLQGFQSLVAGPLQAQLAAASQAAFAAGFGDAALLASVVALVACGAVFFLLMPEVLSDVRRKVAHVHCKIVDCRNPI